MEALKQHRHQEKLFLADLKEELQCTKDIVSTLRAELSEMPGCLDEDPEASRFIQDLSLSLESLQYSVDRRCQQLQAEEAGLEKETGFREETILLSGSI